MHFMGIDLASFCDFSMDLGTVPPARVVFHCITFFVEYWFCGPNNIVIPICNDNKGA